MQLPQSCLVICKVAYCQLISGSFHDDGSVMASEDVAASTTEVQAEVSAMGLEPKPETAVNGHAEVRMLKSRYKLRQVPAAMFCCLTCFCDASD